MKHSEETVEEELDRLRNGARSSEDTPVLSVFEVQALLPFDDYSRNLRELIECALELAREGLLSGNEAPPFDTVPDWFKAASDRDLSERVPEFSRAGLRAYQERVESKTWSLESWLFQFDPDIDSRGWQWWGITSSGGTSGKIWVDSWGESFFGCQELRRAAYLAGAVDVSGPWIASTEAWEEAEEVSALT